MTLAAQKPKKSIRGKKKRGGAIANTSSYDNDNQSSSSSAGSSQGTKSTRGRRAAVKDVSNHKITEFFQVRRSNRKTTKQIEEEESLALKDAIETGSNEEILHIFTDPIKGRGIKAGRMFRRGEFVVEYKGIMMEYSKAVKIEEEYSNDDDIGSYMYFFEWNNKKWCIDATEESGYKGRLINHSALRPNLKTKVVQFDGRHHLVLIANQDIKENDELLYNYGDRNASVIAKNPWLVNT